jgi:hypothetical protein
VVVLAAGVGCQDKAGEAEPMRDRQDQAIRDPFGYGPQIDPPTQHRSPISGGGTTEFDREGFDRDFKSVFDP